MADIVLDEQAAPTTPGANSLIIYADTSALPAWKDDAGRNYARSMNAAVAAQGAGFASDTYVTNSDLIIPGFQMQTKGRILWKISGSKTGAGTAAPVYQIRTGSAKTTADTSRLTLTGPAQTAVADIGTLYVMVTVRIVSAVGVIAGTAWWDHRGTIASSTGGTGFANDGSGHVEGTSGTFDNTALGGQFIGLSINGGASASWTITQVHAEANW